MSEVGRCSDDETATPQKMFTAAHHAWAQEHPSLADDCLHELLGYNCMRKRCTADDGVSLHGCRTFSPPISPSYSPSSPLAGEEVPHPQPGGWDLWYHTPSQGGLGNEVPHPQPGALGVGGTTSPARGPACEVLFPPLGQLWTTWRSKGKIAHTQFYEKENPEIQTKFCIY